MFSRKTTRLIERVERAQKNNQTTLTIKHAMDARYADQQIMTHDGLSIPATSVTHANNIPSPAIRLGLLAIDEAHFFGPSLVPVVDHFLAQGTDVVVTGVDLDAEGRPFPPMPELENRATEIIHTHATCARCNAPAYFTQRLVNDSAPVIVGGANIYEPRCRNCFVPVSSTDTTQRS